MLLREGGAPLSGEKMLRFQLLRTPEWSSAEERVRVAAQHADDPEMAGLVKASTELDPTALRKRHLLALSRVWVGVVPPHGTSVRSHVAECRVACVPLKLVDRENARRHIAQQHMQTAACQQAAR